MKYEQQNIFFISDQHAFHKNVIKYDQRPFEDIDIMTEELVRRWNSVISDNDIVYNLGDLSFYSIDRTKWFVDRLNGKIHHIMGNHDRVKDIIKLDRFEQVYEYGTEIWIKDDDLSTTKQVGYQQIIMSHYPLLSWNREHHGSIHLHGHCHGSLVKSNQEYYKRKVMDVGCNMIDYTPISYDQVKKVMSTKNHVYNHH